MLNRKAGMPTLPGLTASTVPTLGRSGDMCVAAEHDIGVCDAFELGRDARIVGQPYPDSVRYFADALIGFQGDGLGRAGLS